MNRMLNGYFAVKLLENERLYCYNPTYNEIENIESIIRSVPLNTNHFTFLLLR
jgi:hypothetical protein